MTEYRITKYNPANRNDGIYTADEWTSYHDIGKAFGGTVLSREMYLKTENAYIQCCLELMDKAQVSVLSVRQAEYRADGICFPDSVSHAEEILQIITACLREQCWMKLENEDFFIHFGYDFYMYIGAALPAQTVQAVAEKYGLFCELCPSPYRICD